MELTDKQDEAMVKAFSAAAQQRPSIGITAFKAGYAAAVNRECAWVFKPSLLFAVTDCGTNQLMDELPNFCPNCGGKVVEGNI